MQYNTELYEFKPNLYQFLDSIISLKNKKILDWGCKTGGLLFFSEGEIKQENYTGVDVSSKSLKVLKDTFPRAKTIHYDRYNNGYNHNGKKYCSWCLNDKYDVIFSFSVFTHTSFTEFQDVFNKHKEHLNEGGIMIHTFADMKNKEHTRYLLTDEQFKTYSPTFDELYRYDDELSIEYNDKKCNTFNSFFDTNYVGEKLDCYLNETPLLTTAIYERI